MLKIEPPILKVPGCPSETAQAERTITEHRVNFVEGIERVIHIESTMFHDRDDRTVTVPR